MSNLIYVETSVASFYTETRDTEDVRIRRRWTREWWHLPVTRRLVTSFVVRLNQCQRFDAAFCVGNLAQFFPHDK